MKKFLAAAMLLAVWGMGSTPAHSTEINIAKGCPVSVNPNPNYKNTGNTPACLTDGVYTKGIMWNQKGAIAWTDAPIVNITIDLQKVQPISGISFGTAGGADAVLWPGSLLVWTSDDSKEWRYAGDLMTLSEKNGIPAGEVYSHHRFATHDLKAKGRYVRIGAITANSFVFCDEIEVYKGSEGFLSSPYTGKVVSDTDARTREMYFSNRVIYRLSHDAEAVRSAIMVSRIGASRKKALLSQLDKIGSRISGIERKAPANFECILPIDEMHSSIFSVYGSLLKSEGHPSTFLWKKDRYDFLRLTEVPQKSAQEPKLDVSMMRNEYRSDAVLLTNASESAMDAKVTVEGVGGGSKPEWLSIYSMPWTDTATGQPAPAALVPMAYKNGSYSLHVPAGITSKIWVTVDSAKLSAGSYQGKLKIFSAKQTSYVPLQVRVSSLKMARPRLSFCTWEYCVEPGRYAVTGKTFGAALATMRTHFVDTTWAQSIDFPCPDESCFDANGKLVKPLSFDKFDKWVGYWPDARHYIIFLNAPTELGGFKMGTEEFNVRVGSWMNALAEHMRSLGRKPEEIGVMIRDEPGEESQKVIIEWAKAIRAAKSGIQIFQDCNIGLFAQNGYMANALRSADISIPMIGAYYAGGESIKPFYDSLQKSGRKMWMYECEGPARLLDPYRYYRLEAWHCFKHDAVGMGLWAFADTGHFKNSWNEYDWISNEYAPLFFRPTDITESISWEASREGIEDYEYLAMLKDAAARTRNSALKVQASKLSSEAVNSVLGNFRTPQARWIENKESAKADAYRLKVLHLLEKIK